MKMLTSRDDLAHNFTRNGIIAEVGVQEGNFSAVIIQMARPSEMHLIDCWEGHSAESYARVQLRFSKCPSAKIVKGYSVEVAKTYPDHYFDCIYIDAGHEYENILSDLEAWHKKVKIGGIISGHDYVKGALPYIQVVEALEKWMPENGYTGLDYLTMETMNTPGGPPSWGLIVK